MTDRPLAEDPAGCGPRDDVPIPPSASAFPKEQPADLAADLVAALGARVTAAVGCDNDAVALQLVSDADQVLRAAARLATAVGELLPSAFPGSTVTASLTEMRMRTEAIRASIERLRQEAENEDDVRSRHHQAVSEHRRLWEAVTTLRRWEREAVALVELAEWSGSVDARVVDLKQLVEPLCHALRDELVSCADDLEAWTSASEADLDRARAKLAEARQSAQAVASVRERTEQQLRDVRDEDTRVTKDLVRRADELTAHLASNRRIAEALGADPACLSAAADDIASTLDAIGRDLGLVDGRLREALRAREALELS
jgi:chromosome segregation ATPase